MKYIKRIIVGIVPFCCLAIMSMMISCSEAECSLSGRPAVRFSFINSTDGTLVSLFDSLTVTALNTDSVLINKAKGINHISLPMNYIATETVFVLHYNVIFRDTIRLKHTNIPHFISMECGKEMFFQIDEFESTAIILDSIKLSNPDVSKDEKENFKIYYTPTTD